MKPRQSPPPKNRGRDTAGKFLQSPQHDLKEEVEDEDVENED